MDPNYNITNEIEIEKSPKKLLLIDDDYLLLGEHAGIVEIISLIAKENVF